MFERIEGLFGEEDKESLSLIYAVALNRCGSNTSYSKENNCLTMMEACSIKLMLSNGCTVEVEVKTRSKDAKGLLSYVERGFFDAMLRDYSRIGSNGYFSNLIDLTVESGLAADCINRHLRRVQSVLIDVRVSYLQNEHQSNSYEVTGEPAD